MSGHKINSIQNIINCFILIKKWQVQTSETWSGNKQKTNIIYFTESKSNALFSFLFCFSQSLVSIINGKQNRFSHSIKKKQFHFEGIKINQLFLYFVVCIYVYHLQDYLYTNVPKLCISSARLPLHHTNVSKFHYCANFCQSISCTKWELLKNLFTYLITSKVFSIHFSHPLPLKKKDKS